MKSFKEYFSEELSTKEIDPKEFPNPITDTLRKIFIKKGRMDGSVEDDIVQTKKQTWTAKNLKASQDAVYLGKALGMAVGGVKGGDLGAIISSDKRILDGHHRWAATMFNDPSAKIGGIEARLGIGDLVPVLRALGDVFKNKRRGAPGGGDKNIFQATVADAEKALLTGKYMNPKFYDKEKSTKWLESIGGKSVLGQRLKKIQKSVPPKGAPERAQMPVIDADIGQHKKAAKLLKKGDLDVRKPYYNKKK